ncbi:MAG: DUF5615 family PIN-like protein [Anaerolineae bacterium]|nr:DUF5615 family PIN-like protein [Anaerolineae bacterium]
MKFIADENVDRPIVDRLLSDGHDVAYVADIARGASDDTVLNLADRMDAILITGDKDFGEMMVRQEKAAKGTILLRLAGLPNDRKADLVASAVSQHSHQLVGSFVVISPAAIRIRRLNP